MFSAANFSFARLARPPGIPSRGIFSLLASSWLKQQPLVKEPNVSTPKALPVQESPSLYPGHRPVRGVERAILTVGSGVTALLDQRRGDMVAVFGETTGELALKQLKHKMMQDRDGRRILRERPRINSETLQFDRLRTYPEGSLGRVYADFMDRNKITPDSRLPVRYVDDPELAYVMQRYREIHDFTHAILEQPTNLTGEVVVKWFEAVQTELPMCALGGFGATFKLPQSQQAHFWREVIRQIVQVAMDAKLLMTVYFEQHLEEPLQSLKEEWNLKALPLVT